MPKNLEAIPGCGSSLVARLEGGDYAMRLTQAAISAAVYEKSGGASDVRWDDSLPGFGVRIYPTGKKSFVLKYRIHGRQRLMTIGSCAVLSLDDARARAKRAQVQLLDNEDPLLKRESKVMMFDELSERFIDERASRKKSGFEDVRRINNFLLPIWKNRSAVSITRSEVKDLHREITNMKKDKQNKRGGAYSANRVLELIHTMFVFASKEKYIPSAHENPASGIEENPEFPSERYVDDETEMPALAAAIQEESWIYMRAAIWLYLLTGLRRDELLSTPWSDVNLERGILRIPGRRMKNGQAEWQRLSPPAQMLLANLPRVDGNPYIFVSERVKGNHMKTITRKWQRVRKRAGLPDLDIHDLRRTVGAWMAMSGVSTQVIAKVLGHKSLNATLIYARVADKTVHREMDRHGEVVSRFMPSEFLRRQC